MRRRQPSAPVVTPAGLRYAGGMNLRTRPGSTRPTARPIASLVAGCIVVASVVSACSDDGVPADGDETVGAPETSAVSSSPTDGDAATGATADPSDDGVGSSGAASAETSAGPNDTGTGTVPEGTAGCGIPYAGEAVVEGSIDVDGEARTFILAVPAGYDPAVPMPLVFAWHGLGGNAQLARLYFDVEQQSAGQAIFVYPDGLPQATSGGSTGWDLADGSADMLLFDALLEEMSSNLCVDPARIFSTGHSFGGYMSNALGCFRADVLRAIAPVAGGPPFGMCQSGRVAAWMTHGTMDGVVPFAQGQAALDAVLARNGCGSDPTPVPPEPCVGYDGCDPDYPVTWCAHDLADQDGHLWPPFAAEAIWSFFAGLPAPASP